MKEYKSFKMENLQEDLLLSLHTKFPNTIDDNAILSVAELGYEKGKAHGCIYSGNAHITNVKKGIGLNFKIWFSVYCEPYSIPDTVPNVASYLTGKYQEIQRTSDNIPELAIDSVELLNVPEPKTIFTDEPTLKRYFDGYWHLFETEKENYVLSKEGWFGEYVHDKNVGIRKTTPEDMIDLGNGSSQLKPHLGKFVDSEEVKDFIKRKYYNKIDKDLFVEL